MTKYAKRVYVMEEEAKKLDSLTGNLTSNDIISFAAGAPAKEAYPFDALREISQDVFQKSAKGYESVKYGSAVGFPSLREMVCEELLTPRGLHTKAENVMITSGGIQPMNLLCQLLIDPGDVILVETPTFVHTTMIFKMFQAKVVPCVMDDDGMVLEDVEEKIKKYRPKMVYTIPTFQNPTGITMSLERRRRLAELGSKYDVVILEDDPYREIRYSGEHLLPIKAFDTTGHTVFANSFSKIFSPGSRLGYLVASDEMSRRLSDIKLGTDTCTNTIAQAICTEFFKKGYYPDHLKRICDIYRGRRDVMLESIDAYFPERTKHTCPDGGYYVWVELPKSIDATELASRIAKELNICYGIGSAFYSEGAPEGAGRNCMRMNFSGLEQEVIRENVKKLGEFLQEER